MNKLMKKMFEERDDFMGYVWMIKDCTDPTVKAHLKQIAEQELHHYKHLYDIVFAGAEKNHLSHLEEGIYEYALSEYQHMLKKLEEIKVL